METPSTQPNQTIEPPHPVPGLDDLPPQLRQEALNILAAMLLSLRHQQEPPDEPRS